MADEARDESQARKITPFKIIQAGEDTLDADNEVQFSDFRPRTVSADTPEEVIEPAPKDSSAPAPAPSPESTQTTEPQKSDNPVQAPADEGTGKPSQTKSGSQSSSSDQNPG